MYDQFGVTLLKIRNNLHINLHVCFPRRKDLPQIRDSQHVFVTDWRSAGCMVGAMFG